MRLILLATVVVFTGGGPLLAGPPGSIAGTIRDASGATLPGALVRIVNEDSGASVETVTDTQGTYHAPALTPGKYRVETTFDRFATDVRRVEVGPGETLTVDVTLRPSVEAEAVVVTARRIEETEQQVPIALSVVNGAAVADSGSFDVARLQELVPAVQFYSTNPRNSAINIRGLGAPFGLTNDGLEPGVGLYIDGVYFARSAAATLDFLDVDRVEVLRGPQGTLFGKNTTAGAINISTRQPTFAPESELELNYGTIGFIQARGAVSGRLWRSLAGRLAFSGTTRDGTVENARTQQDVNTLNNLGVRAQLLFAPSNNLAITATVDDSRQRPDGYTQVIAGVAPTLKAPSQQYPAIAARLGYTPPSFNAFDRLTDIDTPVRSNQDLGGASVNVDWKLGPGRLASTTGWRYWNWNPSSDRDFTGLPITTISAAPSKQRQWTQEIRYASAPSRHVSFVAGIFGFHQTIRSDPAFVQEQGADAAAFLLPPTAAAATPGLLDGYGYKQHVSYDNTSAAAYGQVAWAIGDRLKLLPGLRLNYDHKKASFDQETYGGLQTTDPTLVALQQSIFAPQAYTADVGATNLSGEFTAMFRAAAWASVYATYASGFKSVGLNLNGLPTDAQNRPVLDDATVKPEDVHNIEIGVKTTPIRGVTVNLAAYDTNIRNFQTQVTNGSIGVIRGYLANAEKAQVRGAEFDATARVARPVLVYARGAYTDARYVTFTDAPPPIEDVGGPQFVDISGSVLPGISRWSFSYGGEYDHPGVLFDHPGSYFAAVDASYRSWFSSSATYSTYLVVPGYSLLNARLGYRFENGWTLYVWSRNLLNKNYYELLSVVAGNSGLFVGQPGDPRTAGVTLRVALGRNRHP